MAMAMPPCLDRFSDAENLDVLLDADRYARHVRAPAASGLRPIERNGRRASNLDIEQFNVRMNMCFGTRVSAVERSTSKAMKRRKGYGSSASLHLRGSAWIH